MSGKYCLALLLLSGKVIAENPGLGEGRWLDLSHAYSEETLYWPTARRFEKETVFEGVTEGGWYYTAYDIHTAEHGGTHVDAPIHFSAGRRAVDEIPLDSLVGPGVVIDISEQASANPDYQLSVMDLECWELTHGPIAQGSIVLVKTGFAERWPDAEKYLGTAERGEAALPHLHFPGIHPDAARILVQRKISAVGLDTASVDFGQSADFMTHRILYEANIPGFENVAELSSVPVTGALVIALPMKIAGGSGAPLRIVAFVPEG